MGFYQFFIIFICNTYLILFNAFTATADVRYVGPERVAEHSNFSISCNASPFSYIKWRLKDTTSDFGVCLYDTKSDRCSTIYVPSAKRTHTGTYTCSNQEDDFGHNLTVILDDSSTSNYQLTIKLPDNSAACPAQLSNAGFKCAAGNALSSFALDCDVSPQLLNEHTLAWYRGPNKSEKASLIEANERMKLQGNRLLINPVEVTDAGVYHCRVVKKGEEKSGTQPYGQDAVQLVVPPRVRTTPKEAVGIEENPIHLNCTVMTNGPVTVKWRVDNGVIKNENLEASTSKYQLSGNDSTLLKDGMFTIKAANLKDDRGAYTCWAVSEIYGTTSTNMTFNVRIKGKYAALWPFLGICAEVVILCVIILIYEKKRDKTELEESDTDQGPETKSSPDHVQDNVRYRK